MFQNILVCSSPVKNRMSISWVNWQNLIGKIYLLSSVIASLFFISGLARLLLKTISVSPNLLLLHGSSTLNIFLDLRNGYFLFLVLELYLLLKLLKRMLGLETLYLTCHLQNDLIKQKGFLWLKVLSFFANLSYLDSFSLIIYRKFMHFNIALKTAVIDHVIWKYINMI